MIFLLHVYYRFCWIKFDEELVVNFASTHYNSNFYDGIVKNFWKIYSVNNRLEFRKKPKIVNRKS